MPECRLDQLTAADLPRLFGRYELQCILGAGGMGSVLGAELHGPAGFRKPVAIKVLQPEVVGQLSVSKVAAFIREARLGGLLKHPNIVEVYELAEVDDQLFISMEWVRYTVAVPVEASRAGNHLDGAPPTRPLRSHHHLVLCLPPSRLATT